MQCNTVPYIIGHGKHRPCKNRAETVQPWLTKQKSHEIFRFTASTVDIPTRWNPRAKQQQRVALADFSAAPWQGFEKSERGPNNSSLFQPQAAVVVVALGCLLPRLRRGRAVRVPDSPYTNISPRITQKEMPLTSVSGFCMVEHCPQHSNPTPLHGRWFWNRP